MFERFCTLNHYKSVWEVKQKLQKHNREPTTCSLSRTNYSKSLWLTRHLVGDFYHKKICFDSHSSTYVTPTCLTKHNSSSGLKKKRWHSLKSKITINIKAIQCYVKSYNGAQEIIQSSPTSALSRYSDCMCVCSVRFCHCKDLCYDLKTPLHWISWSINIWQKLKLTLSHIAGMCHVYSSSSLHLSTLYYSQYIQTSGTFDRHIRHLKA